MGAPPAAIPSLAEMKKNRDGFLTHMSKSEKLNRDDAARNSGPNIGFTIVGLAVGAGLGIAGVTVGDDNDAKVIASVGSLGTAFITGIMTAAGWAGKTERAEQCAVYLNTQYSVFKTRWEDARLPTPGGGASELDKWKAFEQQQDAIVGTAAQLGCRMFKKEETV